jgi:hypothetical protein
VLMIFEPREDWGFVYTKQLGKKALNKPALYIRDVPRSKAMQVASLLDYLGGVMEHLHHGKLIPSTMLKMHFQVEHITNQTQRMHFLGWQKHDMSIPMSKEKYEDLGRKGMIHQSAETNDLWTSTEKTRSAPDRSGFGDMCGCHPDSIVYRIVPLFLAKAPAGTTLRTGWPFNKLNNYVQRLDISKRCEGVPEEWGILDVNTFLDENIPIPIQQMNDSQVRVMLARMNQVEPNEVSWEEVNDMREGVTAAAMRNQTT